MKRYILLACVVFLSGCWKYNIANLGKYTDEHETWRKQGVSPVLGIRKALLECGRVSLGGVTKQEYEKVGLIEQKDQTNHRFLVDRCMINAGFIQQNTSWTLQDACADKRYRDYPACQPDAVIPTPSVERRLNSWYCKVKSDYSYCLKYSLNPTACSPEDARHLPPECLPVGQAASQTKSMEQNQWGQTPLISSFKHKYNVQTLLITAAN